MHVYPNDIGETDYESKLTNHMGGASWLPTHRVTPSRYEEKIQKYKNQERQILANREFDGIEDIEIEFSQETNSFDYDAKIDKIQQTDENLLATS